MLLNLLAVIAIGCAPGPQKPLATNDFADRWPTTPEGRRVLVIWNRSVPEGKTLAEYYAKARGVPVENIHMINVLPKEYLAIDELQKNIFDTTNQKIKTLKTQVDFIVLMKGMPILVWDESKGYSVDAYLSVMNMGLKRVPNDPPKPEDLDKIRNPYFGKNEPFNSKKYGMYLVTRLDGYTFADARKLVDNSMHSKAHKGLFLLDTTGNRGNGGYGVMHDELVKAGELLKAKGFETNLDMNTEFAGSAAPLAGYCSWGSNDPKFDAARYKSLKFLPGAIGETFVSTSARTMEPVSQGQSVITDLVASGITGVKGYVKEPYTFALAKPALLFDRYTSGYTLAESFSMASPFLKWRELVIGDPICAPYRKK